MLSLKRVQRIEVGGHTITIRRKKLGENVTGYTMQTDKGMEIWLDSDLFLPGNRDDLRRTFFHELVHVLESVVDARVLGELEEQSVDYIASCLAQTLKQVGTLNLMGVDV